jgi:3-mercaptopyruvate sulfurtransferase SseA
MKKRKTTKVPIAILVAGGFLLILAAAILFMQNQPNPDNSLPTAVVNNQGEQASQEIQRVSLEDAKAALDAKTAVFVDVRGDNLYAESHIPGALSIPLTDLENHLDELNPADWIITYCT